jgi:hypothetical protein
MRCLAPLPGIDSGSMMIGSAESIAKTSRPHAPTASPLCSQTFTRNAPFTGALRDPAWATVATSSERGRIRALQTFAHRLRSPRGSPPRREPHVCGSKHVVSGTIIGARQIDCGAGIEADLCIVGAGAAGVTIARTFAGKTVRVCLIESGGLAYNALINSLSAADNIGLLYWPLDEHAFRERPWIRDSGWPFDYRELVPYCRLAERICELSSESYRTEDWISTLADARAAILPVRADCVETWLASRLEGAWHPLGTTRMHDDPRRGVVDRDCRVHESNLFIAGGSVFPMAGSAQPTLTIVPLALLLSEQLMSLVARTDVLRVVPSHDRAALRKPSPVHRCSRGAPLQLRPAGAGATWTTGRRPIDLHASTPAGQGQRAVLTKPPEQ